MNDAKKENIFNNEQFQDDDDLFEDILYSANEDREEPLSEELEPCQYCDGTGFDPIGGGTETCAECDGTGEVEKSTASEDELPLGYLTDDDYE